MDQNRKFVTSFLIRIGKRQCYHCLVNPEQDVDAQDPHLNGCSGSISDRKGCDGSSSGLGSFRFPQRCLGYGSGNPDPDPSSFKKFEGME